MPANILIFICDQTSNAISSSKLLPRQRDLNRFFVFIGEKPTEDELSFLSPQDIHVCLHGLASWNEQGDQAAIRAGILYSNAYHLIFCKASQPPALATVNSVKNQLNSGSSLAHGENVWGVSREHIVLNGFNDAYIANSPQEDKLLEEHHINEIEITKAMMGLPVTAAAILLALREVVPLQGMHLDIAQPGEFDALLHSLFRYATSVDSELPTTILLGECSYPQFKNALSRTPTTGAVVLPVKQPEMWIQQDKPYRRFRCIDGYEVLIFSGQEST